MHKESLPTLIPSLIWYQADIKAENEVTEKDLNEEEEGVETDVAQEEEREEKE